MSLRHLIFALLCFAAPAQAATDIACLGDSITYTSVARAPVPWPHILETSLNAQYPGQYTVSNFGTPGHTASQNLSTWTSSIRGKGYEILVVLTGINSILTDVTGANTWTSINTIVDEAKADGMTVVLITTMPFGSYTDWTAGRQTQLDALLTSIRAEGGVTLVDLYPDWETSPGSDQLLAAYDVGDFLHINAAGCTNLAGRVETALGL